MPIEGKINAILTPVVSCCAKMPSSIEVDTKAADVLQEHFDRHDHLEIDDEKQLAIHK